MRESASLSFISTIHDLLAMLHQCENTVEAQILEGQHPRMVRFVFRGRVSRWYSQHHSTIISTARSCSKHKDDAMKKTAEITVSAYTSGSGQSGELTKGKGFDAYLYLLPETSKMLGAQALGERAVLLYECIDSMIKNMSGNASGSASKASKEKRITTTQMQQADALAEAILADIPDPELRHRLRDQIKRADNKLSALTQLLNQK